MINTYTHFMGKKLQHFYSIRIDRTGESVKVTFCSTIHVNREYTFPMTFCHEFTDEQILRDGDLASQFNGRWGNIYACTCH